MKYYIQFLDENKETAIKAHSNLDGFGTIENAVEEAEMLFTNVTYRIVDENFNTVSKSIGYDSSKQKC